MSAPTDLPASRVYNRPGRSSLSYRAGTYTTFLARMAAQLRSQRVPDEVHPGTLLPPPLAKLSLESENDWVLALLEAWAATGDVLTFYQERIANEGYLRTAVQPLSVQELVRTLGYAPRPGIAAATHLAFTTLAGRGLPSSVTVAAGTAVRSIPVGGQLPQVFELGSPLLTQGPWSAMKPVLSWLTRTQSIGPETTAVLLAGNRTGLRTASPFLVTAAGAPGSPGSPGSNSAGPLTFFRTAESVTVERTRRPAGTPVAAASLVQAPDSTRLTWQPALGGGSPGEVFSDPQVLAFRRRGNLFGYNAQPWDKLPDPVKQKIGTRRGGVARSRDRGRSFDALNQGLPTTDVKALAFTPSGGLVAGTTAGVFRFTAEGWKPPSSGLGRIAIQALAAAPGGHLFAGTAAGVFRSTDGGASWAAVTAPAVRPQSKLKQRLQSLLARSSRATAVVKTIAGVLVGSPQPKVQPRLPTTTVQALATAGDARVGYLFAGTSQGVFRSGEAGGGWLPVNTGLPGTDRTTGLTSLVVRALAVGPKSQLYAATDRGVFTSKNLGRRWRDANAGLPGTGTATGPVTALAVLADRQNGATWLFAATSRGVYRSSGGGRWRPASDGLPVTPSGSKPTPAAVSLLAGAVDAGTLAATLYAVAASGLYRSQDFGASWTAAGATDDPGAPLTALAAGGSDAVAANPFDGYVETEWPGFALHDGQIDLSTIEPTVVPGSWVVLRQNLPQPPPFPAVPPRVGVYLAQAVETVTREDFGLAGKVTRITVQDDGQLALFDLRQTDALLQSTALELFEVTSSAPLPQAQVEVDLPAPQAPPPGRLLVVTGKRIRTLLAGLQGNRLPLANGAGEVEVRPGESGQVLSAQPLDGQTGGPSPAARSGVRVRWQVRLDSGDVGHLAAAPGEMTWQPAQEDDPVVAEVISLAAIAPGTAPGTDGASPTATTVLALAPVLTEFFDPTTVTVNANVGVATQGESVPNEILGSGNAARSFQRFKLGRKPLTYVPTPSGGSASTLQVFVDKVAWQEVSTLYGQGPASQVYTVSLDTEGQALVTFGDGQHGARLPSGVENVTARYRSGVWTQPVETGALSLLQQRPFGLRGVTNPLPVAGGVAPEPPDEARQQAPRTVRTLDRIVSLADYRDYASTYPGISKATARALWTGHSHPVALTVAGVDGEAASADLCRQLRTAIGARRASGQPVAIVSYRPVLFEVAAALWPEPGQDRDSLEAAVGSALCAAFGFASRVFGQGVAASDVVTVMQDVAGVLAVDLTALFRQGETRRLNSFLHAAETSWDWQRQEILPAELLTIDSDGLEISWQGAP